MSEIKPKFAVLCCPLHEDVGVSRQEYCAQLANGEEHWQCPLCDTPVEVVTIYLETTRFEPDENLMEQLDD